MAVLSASAAWWMTQHFVDYKKLKELAVVLLPEVKHNRAICEGFSEVGEKLKAGDEQVRKLASMKTLPPGDFRTTIFVATLSQQGVLPKEILSDLHGFYYQLGQIERFRMAKEEPARTLQDREFFLGKMFEAGAEAMRIAKHRDLVGALEASAQGSGLFRFLGF